MANIKQDIKDKVYKWIDHQYKKMISFDDYGEENLPDLWEIYNVDEGDYEELARKIVKNNRQALENMVNSPYGDILEDYGYSEEDAEEIIKEYREWFDCSTLSRKEVDKAIENKEYSFLLPILVDIMASSLKKIAIREWLEKNVIINPEVELSDEEYDEGFDESINLSGRLKENKKINFLADYRRQIDSCMERLLPTKRTPEEWKEIYYAHEIDNYRSLAFYYVYGSYQNWFKRLVFGSPYDNDFMCTRLRKEYDYTEDDVEQILEDYEPFRKKYSNFSRETINKNFSKDKQFVNMIQLLLNHDKQFSVMPYVEEILKNNPSITEPKLEVELSDEEYDEGFDD